MNRIPALTCLIIFIQSLGTIVSSAAEDPVAIVPPKLASKLVRVELPGTCDDLCVGGRGRFIILRVPKLDKLVVFDTNEASIIGSVPSGLFAAGLEQLIVVEPTERSFRRYRLPDLKLLGAGKLPGDRKIYVTSMGNASRGPLLVAMTDCYAWFDPETMTQQQSIVIDQNKTPGREPHGELQIRGSASGNAFGCWHPRGTQGFLILSDKGVYRIGHAGHGYAVPDENADRIYTAEGAYSADGFLFEPWGREGLLAFPAVHGPYRVQLAPHSRPPQELPVFLAGQAEPLVKVPSVDLEYLLFTDDSGRELLSIDKRVFVLPDAKLVITLNKDQVELILHQADPYAVWTTASHPFMVISLPRLGAEVGKAWRYRPRLLSKRGGLKIKLVSGPEGMAIDGQTLTWTPSEEPREEKQTVVLEVTEDSGATVQQVFDLHVSGFKPQVKRLPVAPRR